MALPIAYPRARHAAALLVAGLALGLPAVASASDPFPSGARIRFSTTGVPVWTSPVAPAASTAAGGGAALLRATQSLNIGGVSVPIALTRNVPVSNVARVLAVGARFSGPLLVAGLVYEGVMWVSDEWRKVDGLPHYVAGTFNWDQCGELSPGQFGQFPGGALYYLSAEKAGDAGDPPAGMTWSNNCNKGGTYYPLAIGVGMTLPEQDTIPATEDDLQISFQQGLIEAPSMAPTLLDLALQDSRARAALVADALGLEGPAAVEGPSTTTTEVAPGGNTTINRSVTYNLSFAGDVVTVTETTTTTNVGPSGTTTTTTTTDVPAASEPQSAAPAEDIECGLPGTPKCAIDETGTPEADATVSAATAALEAAWQEREQQVQSATEVEDFGWSWTLPTLTANCSPIQVGDIVSLNLCPGLDIGRVGFAFLWPVLGGIYCWRRVTGAIERGV